MGKRPFFFSPPPVKRKPGAPISLIFVHLRPWRHFLFTQKGAPSRSLSDTSWPFGHPSGTACGDHPSSRDGGSRPVEPAREPWSRWLPVNSSLVQPATVDEIDGCRGRRVPRPNARKRVGVSDLRALRTSACALRSDTPTRNAESRFALGVSDRRAIRRRGVAERLVVVLFSLLRLPGMG